MTVEIIAIGDEVLAGITVNTNAAFISKGLNLRGFQVERQSVLPDSPEVLERAFREALERSKIVITTGGLGPTCDDLTRDVAAKLFNSPLHTDPELEKDLKIRFGDQLDSLAHQSLVPTKAKLLKNRIGTAAGLLFSEGGKVLALLPGVPQEMMPMFENELLPHLNKYLSVNGEIPKTVLLYFGLLWESAVDPLLRELSQKYPTVQCGIYPSFGFLGVRFTSSDYAAQEECIKALKIKFGEYLFEDPQGKIEKAVHTLFIDQNLTLACAESCTGGQIAAKITAQAGASNYFLGSLVTYSNSTKMMCLGVGQKTIEKFGAVSRETVLEMATGVREKTGADVGLAISGIAGPDGGTSEKPVGTVWIGIAQKGQPVEALCMHLRGSRETIITGSTNSALFFLWRKLAKGDSLLKWETQ